MRRWIKMGDTEVKAAVEEYLNRRSAGNAQVKVNFMLPSTDIQFTVDDKATAEKTK